MESSLNYLALKKKKGGEPVTKAIMDHRFLELQHNKFSFDFEICCPFSPLRSGHKIQFSKPIITQIKKKSNDVNQHFYELNQ